MSEGPLSSTDSEGGGGKDKKKVPPSSSVPAAAAALELRFQAELNQMEVIQQAEKQLNQISQFKDAVDACHLATQTGQHQHQVIPYYERTTK